MFRSLIVLFAIVVVGANAQATCDVGELEKVSDLCKPGADNSRCTEYCQKKYGAELAGSQCSETRQNGKRECICRLKCCNIGCWGDPHCWTCDGVKFGYQGLKKHVLMKPITEYKTMPNFYISQINKPWQGGAMAILDISELVVPEWKKTVEIKVPDAQAPHFTLKINGRIENIPYRFSELDNNRERFISILYGDVAKTQLVLLTSFGLRMTYSSKGAGTTSYSDLSIDFPRHPELKDNSHGLLGRWNGNPADDSVDGDGHKQTLDDGFSWAFGDSWIIREGRTKTADCERNEKVKQKDEKIKHVSSKTKEKVEKICLDALGSAELKACAAKIGRAVPLIKNCVVDLLFIDDDKTREKYLNELISTFTLACKNKDKAPNKPKTDVSVVVGVSNK